MSALVRSSFHAFTLAMLACACTLVAQTINTVVSTSLLPLPTAPILSGPKPPAATAGTTPPLSAELMARQMGLSLKEPSQAIAEPPVEAQPSQLALKLLGTMTSTSSGLSLASIYDDAQRRTRTVWAGSMLQGAEVLSIERTRVLLSNGGRVEILDILSVPATPGSTPPPPSPSALAGASSGFGSTIRQTGPESYSIQRQDVENALANMNQLAMQARIVPSFRGGTAQGFKLFAMKPDSLYARLGMKNGDILQRINGFTMDDPARALEAYSHLKGASRIELEIERDGQPLRKTYTVEN
ncbi:type II secretion system protein GspC [Hyalangium versicolor]|uniref:type II secretion system protein GspC n=1 Tax=Hyalangium versicolor TaxID=2861190 RepID=UPI001CCEE709|nr:type II secretion system protein GspC [Hyalangium versicolor]